MNVTLFCLVRASLGRASRMKAQVRSAEERAASMAFPPLKKPHILICNICAGRAIQNGCSSEDDSGVCSNLELGHLQRFCTDVSIHNVALSSALVPREGYFEGERCIFFFICSCRWKNVYTGFGCSCIRHGCSDNQRKVVVQHKAAQ